MVALIQSLKRIVACGCSAKKTSKRTTKKRTTKKRTTKKKIIRGGFKYTKKK